MTEKLSRRSFFRLAGGGIAAAVIAPQALLEKIINIPVEFGWTWYVDKTKVPSTLSEIVTSTLRANTQKIAENVSANNALLMKLKDGTKVNLQIEPISPEAQTKRMGERHKARLVEREKQRLAKLDHLSDENKEWLRKRSEAALKSDGFDWDERRVVLKDEETDDQIIENRRRRIANYTAAVRRKNGTA